VKKGERSQGNSAGEAKETMPGVKKRKALERRMIKDSGQSKLKGKYPGALCGAHKKGEDRLDSTTLTWGGGDTLECEDTRNPELWLNENQHEPLRNPQQGNINHCGRG